MFITAMELKDIVKRYSQPITVYSFLLHLYDRGVEANSTGKDYEFFLAVELLETMRIT